MDPFQIRKMIKSEFNITNKTIWQSGSSTVTFKFHLPPSPALNYYKLEIIDYFCEGYDDDQNIEFQVQLLNSLNRSKESLTVVLTLEKLAQKDRTLAQVIERLQDKNLQIKEEFRPYINTPSLSLKSNQETGLQYFQLDIPSGFSYYLSSQRLIEFMGFHDYEILRRVEKSRKVGGPSADFWFGFQNNTNSPLIVKGNERKIDRNDLFLTIVRQYLASLPVFEDESDESDEAEMEDALEEPIDPEESFETSAGTLDASSASNMNTDQADDSELFRSSLDITPGGVGASILDTTSESDLYKVKGIQADLDTTTESGVQTDSKITKRVKRQADDRALLNEFDQFMILTTCRYFDKDIRLFNQPKRVSLDVFRDIQTQLKKYFKKSNLSENFISFAFNKEERRVTIKSNPQPLLKARRNDAILNLNMTLKSYAMFQEFPGIMEFPVVGEPKEYRFVFRKDLKENPFKDERTMFIIAENKKESNSYVESVGFEPVIGFLKGGELVQGLRGTRFNMRAPLDFLMISFLDEHRKPFIPAHDLNITLILNAWAN